MTAAVLPRPWVAAYPGEVRGATLLEYAALLAGEDPRVEPACVHPVLAAVARAVGQRLDDEPRQDLLGLLGGLVDTAPTGSAHDRQVLAVRLACWAAAYVLPQAQPPDRDVCQTAIDLALAWCDGASTERQRRAVAAAPLRSAAAAWGVADSVARAARDAARATTNTRYAIQSATYAVAWACPAEDLPAFLTGLVGEYDRLVGRTAWRSVSQQDLAGLAVLAGLGG